MKKERNPTPEEFEKIIRWFDSAGKGSDCGFIVIQRRLIQIFAARGCSDAESLVDEVINRVAVRIDTLIAKYSDPLRCCVGFVDNVYREHVRDEIKKLNARQPPKPRPAEQLEIENQCLQQCLRALDKGEHYLFVQYFGGEGRARRDARRKLLVELRLTANALRIQAHRLRKRLHDCMNECLSRT